MKVCFPKAAFVHIVLSTKQPFPLQKSISFYEKNIIHVHYTKYKLREENCHYL
jgi:hypothetical protein